MQIILTCLSEWMGPFLRLRTSFMPPAWRVPGAEGTTKSAILVSRRSGCRGQRASKEVYLHLGRQFGWKSHPDYSSSTSVVFSTSVLEEQRLCKGGEAMLVRHGSCRVRAEVEVSAVRVSDIVFTLVKPSISPRICESQNINADLMLRRSVREVVVRQDGG